jgi:hypothetical protein
MNCTAYDMPSGLRSANLFCSAQMAMSLHAGYLSCLSILPTCHHNEQQQSMQALAANDVACMLPLICSPQLPQ